jgi:hypothetical protein
LTLAESVAGWWGSVSGEWSQFTEDAREANYYSGPDVDPALAVEYATGAVFACQSLAKDSPAPDATIDTPWQAGLSTFAGYFSQLMTEMGGHGDGAKGNFWTAVHDMQTASSKMKALTGQAIPTLTF